MCPGERSIVTPCASTRTGTAGNPTARAALLTVGLAKDLSGAGRIDGLEVACITPELQVRWHMHPDYDDVDWADMRRLSGRFGLELPAPCVERPGFIAPKRAADAMWPNGARLP